MTVEVSIDRLRPSRRTLLYAALVVNGELALVLFYFAVSSAEPADLVFLAYPFVWINVAALGVAAVDLPAASRKRRWAAYAVGVAYFLVLGGVGGLYLFHGANLGARVSWLSPGWGPALLYSGESLTVSLLPFKVIGYAALAYLVVATILDAARTGVAGLLGLFACVSCTWPVAATVLTGAFGSASVAASVATDQPYALSTFVYVSSVALLAWRPAK